MMVSNKQEQSIINDKKRDRARFEATKLGAAQRNIHAFAAIASIASFLFIISDLMYIQSQTGRLIAAIIRYCFAILLILSVRKLQRMRTFAAFASFVSALEAIAIVLFFSVLSLYESHEFMIQALGLVTVVLVIFIVPNRSENMLILSLCASVVFFTFFYFHSEYFLTREYIVAAAYAIITIVLCAVKTFGTDRSAQAEFLAKERLEQSSMRDFLTNAATRERLEEEARRWMNFCRRQSLPLCLVFVDVDDLKRINDHYGHTMGDLALKEIARVMQNQLRNSDTIARWGGDEFIILLPNVTLQNAVLLLDRVKSAVCQMRLDGGISVSCSFGVVQMRAESTYTQLLEEADAMMYRAKQSGKGRIGYPNQNAEDG